LKVLTINCVFNIGSTGKIIKEIAEKNENCEFYFCYETGPASSDKTYRIAGYYEQLFYYALARITGLKYCTGYTSTMRLLLYIKKVKPDVVHIHSPNIHTVHIPWLLNYLKKKLIPTVITNHAEFFYTGNCPHSFDCLKFQTGCGHCDYVFDSYRKFWFDRTSYEWRKMKQAFEGFEKLTMVAVSPWVYDRVKLSPISKHLHTVVIKNGIDCENVFLNRDNHIKQTLGIDHDRKVIVHVTASFTDDPEDAKGGTFVIELSKILSDVEFVVVGPIYIKQPQEISANMTLVGLILNQIELAGYYSMADLTLITSKRETYSMTTAESLCCGTPVIGFYAGGPETIALHEYCRFVEYENVRELAEAARELLELKSSRMNTIQNAAKREYSSSVMAKKYLEVYQNITTEQPSVGKYFHGKI